MLISKWFLAACLIATCAATASFAQDGAAAPAVRLTTGIKGNQTFRGISLSRDGAYGVLSTLEHFTVIQIATGMIVAEAKGDQSWVIATAIDPQNRYIVSAGSGGVKLWHFPTLTFQKNLATGDFQDVKASADGNFAAAVDFEGNLHVWATADWSVRRKIKTDGPIRAVAISSNGDIVAVAQGYKDQRPRTKPEGTSPARIVAWSTRTESGPLWSADAHEIDIAAIEFLDSDRKVISAAASNSNKGISPTLKLWNASTGKIISDFGGFRGNLIDLNVVHSSPDRIYAVSQNGVRNRQIISVSTDRQAVDPVCPDNAVAIDKLAISASGDVALGAPAWGSGIITWNPFPDCSKAKSVGLSDMSEQPRRLYAEAEKLLVLAYKDRLIGFDLKAGKTRFSIASNYADVRDIHRGPKDNQFMILVGSAISIHNLKSGAQEERFELKSGGRQYGRVFLIDDKRVALTLEDSSVRLPGHSGSGTGELLLFDISTGLEIATSPKVHDDDIVAMAAAPLRNLIVTGSWDGTIKAIDLTMLSVRSTYRNRPRSQVTSLAMSPNGSEFVATWIYTPDGTGTIGKWAIDSEQALWTAGRYEGFRTAQYAQDGAQILVGGKELLAISDRDGSTKIQYRGVPAGESIWSASFVGTNSLILAVALSGNTFLWKADGIGPGPVAEMLISPSRWFAYSGSRFDVSAFDLLGPIGWIVSDAPFQPLAPEIFMRDHYQPRLLSRLLACHEAEAQNSDACALVFPALPSFETLNRVQPKVKITAVHRGVSPEIALVDVEVAETKDPTQRNGKTETAVYDLRVFRKGQMVGQWPEPKGVEIDPDDRASWRENAKVLMPQGSSSMTRTFEVQLASRDRGKPVSFAAYAFNEDRVKSLTIPYDKYKVPDDIVARKPRAYVIAIGVNAYQDASRNLSFAVKDASELTRALQLIKDYEVIPVSLVSDYARKDGTVNTSAVDHATKRNIQTVLDLLAGKGEQSRERMASVIGASAYKLSKATPDDLVILVFSGHGHTDMTGRFYLMPSDSGAGEVNSTELQKLISSDELGLWLRKVDAGDTVIIIDACHSAASLDVPGFKPGPMGDRGLGQLAYDKGVRVLAATQANDVAIESEKIGQGLLTYALVHEGLRSKDQRGKWKADLNGDGAVTMEEWLAYAEGRVPALYEEIRTGKLRIRDSTVDPLFREKVVRRAQVPSLFDFHRHDRSIIVQ